MSVPHLFRLSAIGTSSIAAATSSEMTTLRERNSILARKNAHLNQELTTLKHFIESLKCSGSRALSNNDAVSSHHKSSPKAISKHSRTFDLAADLMQVN